MTSDVRAREPARADRNARPQPALAVAPEPISREQALSLLAESGHRLEDYPAHVIRRAYQRATARFQQVMNDDDLTPTSTPRWRRC